MVDKSEFAFRKWSHKSIHIESQRNTLFNISREKSSWSMATRSISFNFEDEIDFCGIRTTNRGRDPFLKKL